VILQPAAVSDKMSKLLRVNNLGYVFLEEKKDKQ
jgi:hypothetical protein